MNVKKLITVVTAILSVFILLITVQAFADDSKPLDQKGHDERVKREKATKERVDRENKVQRELDEIRRRAKEGGYEKEYDKAVEKYGGPRTKELVNKNKPKTGRGHPGEHSQPGLTGKEGMR